MGKASVIPRKQRCSAAGAMDELLVTNNEHTFPQRERALIQNIDKLVAICKDIHATFLSANVPN